MAAIALWVTPGLGLLILGGPVPAQPDHLARRRAARLWLAPLHGLLDPLPGDLPGRVLLLAGWCRAYHGWTWAFLLAAGLAALAAAPLESVWGTGFAADPTAVINRQTGPFVDERLQPLQPLASAALARSSAARARAHQLVEAAPGLFLC